MNRGKSQISSGMCLQKHHFLVLSLYSPVGKTKLSLTLNRSVVCQFTGRGLTFYTLQSATIKRDITRLKS